MAETGYEIETADFSAQEFWDRYFRRRLRTMQRTHMEGYKGVLADLPDKGMLIGLDKRFDIKDEAIRDFAYAEDVRFSLGVHPELNGAIADVLRAPLMRQDSLPNRRQLKLVWDLLQDAFVVEFEPYDVQLAATLKRLEKKEVVLEDALYYLTAHKPDEMDHQKYSASGNLLELNDERELLLKASGLLFTQPDAVESLIQVVTNHQFEDLKTVDIALWALGRQNHKPSLKDLFGWLADTDKQMFHPAIERAIQFIVCGSDFIGYAETSPVDHWRRVLSEAPGLDDAAGWAEVDVASIFWEKRQRCAAQWSATNEFEALLTRLRDDEVATVAQSLPPRDQGEIV